MKLSRNFSLSEFIRSDTADRLGIQNLPRGDHMTNLTALALGMEQVRRLMGNRIVTITSGYRNPEVNAAVGGVLTSHHALGWAADFTVKGLDPYDVAREISLSDMAYDQVIYEKGRGIVHISFAPELRQQNLSQHQGPTGPTLQGIVA